MMDQKQNKFNLYINDIKQKSKKEKQDIVIYEIKKLLKVIEKMKIDANINGMSLFDEQKLYDFNDSNRGENFEDVMLVYIHFIQEFLAEYLNFILDVAYVDVEKEEI